MAVYLLVYLYNTTRFSENSPHELELPLRRYEGDGPIGVELSQPHAAVEGAVVQRHGRPPVRPAPRRRVSLHDELVVEPELAVGHPCARVRWGIDPAREAGVFRRFDSRCYVRGGRGGYRRR